MYVLVIDLRLCIQIIQNVKPSAVEKTHLKLNVPTQKSDNISHLKEKQFYPRGAYGCAIMATFLFQSPTWDSIDGDKHKGW
jgi:hypothetical protein